MAKLVASGGTPPTYTNDLRKIKLILEKMQNVSVIYQFLNQIQFMHVIDNPIIITIMLSGYRDEREQSSVKASLRQHHGLCKRDIGLHREIQHGNVSGLQTHQRHH